MEIFISNFGPIKTAKMPIKDINFLIGPQASGKSSIIKLVNFFLQARDIVKSYVLDNLKNGTGQNKGNKISFELNDALRRNFVPFFGPMVHAQNMLVKYDYGNSFSMTLMPDTDPKRPVFLIGESLLGVISEIFHKNSSTFKSHYSNVRLFSDKNDMISSSIISKIESDISDKINKHFSFDYNLIFIPASRGITSTLCEQLMGIDPKLIDTPTKNFIDRSKLLRSYFTHTVDEIINSDPRLKGKSFSELVNRMRRILKGNFYDDNEGGRIEIGNKKYVKLNFSSSGQQECLWVLLTLFLVAIEGANVLFFIEEPEAHLFPEAQMDMVEFMANVHTLTRCKFLITTHSPYILSAANNLLYADRITNSGKDVSHLIPRELHLPCDLTTSFMIREGRIISIFDETIKQIDAAAIDSCSEKINQLYSQLEDEDFKK